MDRRRSEWPFYEETTTWRRRRRRPAGGWWQEVFICEPQLNRREKCIVNTGQTRSVEDGYPPLISLLDICLWISIIAREIYRYCICRFELCLPFCTLRIRFQMDSWGRPNRRGCPDYLWYHLFFFFVYRHLRMDSVCGWSAEGSPWTSERERPIEWMKSQEMVKWIRTRFPSSSQSCGGVSYQVFLLCTRISATITAEPIYCYCSIIGVSSQVNQSGWIATKRRSRIK